MKGFTKEDCANIAEGYLLRHFLEDDNFIPPKAYKRILEIGIKEFLKDD